MNDSDDDRAYSSSPDPLAISWTENNPRFARKTPQKKALAPTFPSKQNSRLSVSDIEYSSPAKSMFLDTPRTHNASPWRIKVTVQAEPGSDEGNASPGMKRYTRTKTTTVPLKDSDSISPSKRGRGRSRVSDIRVPTRSKRNGTPAKNSARAKPRDSSVNAPTSKAQNVGINMLPKKSSGRSRKSVPMLVNDDDIFTAISPQRISLAAEATPFNSKPLTKVRVRKGTPHAKRRALATVLTDEESDICSDLLTPPGSDENNEIAEENTVILQPESDLYKISPEKSKENEAGEEVDMQEFEDDDDGDPEDVPDFVRNNGGIRKMDDTTVMDSEHFTMISVESLLSNKSSNQPVSKARATTEAASRGTLASEQHSSPHLGSSDDNNQSSRVVVSVPTKTDDASPLRISVCERTSIVHAEAPSIPPSLERVPSTTSKTETPRLGRVVTAGVALQGVLDPARLTPQPSQRALEQKRNELDDLFRGFSEGTRRELQAGLRLGEQLAQSGTESRSTTRMSSPVKGQCEAAAKSELHRSHRKTSPSRLLTPEEKDDYENISAQYPEAVDYPALKTVETENQLLSPAGSENEMSWRVDTPPVIVTRGLRRANIEPQIAPTPFNDNVAEDEHLDIWQEEASRSVHSLGGADGDDLPQVQDPLAGEGMATSARGKLPRSWLCTSANDLHYSDEADSTQQHSSQVIEEAPEPEDQEMQDANVASHSSYDSDDTGIFFQSNRPNVLNKKRSAASQQKESCKQSLSAILNEGESLRPESSPPIVAKKCSAAENINPFLSTPPRFSAHLSSPKKSSPLCRELHSGDFSADFSRPIEDESSLPLPQSSPFHTFVDGQTYLSAASHGRQLYYEMEGNTASTIRRVRNEADKYLDAYGPQERSLNEIEEVTEPSHTWRQDPTTVPSSPPQRSKRSFKESMLTPTRPRVPLFGEYRESAQKPPMFTEPVQKVVNERIEQSSDDVFQEDNNASVSDSQQQLGHFSRFTSNLWGALGRTEPPSTPSPHPVVAKLTPLPRLEPWTKTHYKTLDRLYTKHLKHPTMFATSAPSETCLSRNNAAMLEHFLHINNKAYLGATLSAWGYTMRMTEELVVLCATYMQLLTLADVAEYEQVSGQKIQMGDCGPGRAGDVFTGDDVVRRLATVVMGAEMRRDERLGKRVDKSEALCVMWP